MGYSIYVQPVTVYVAMCAEGDCGWTGPQRDTSSEAEQDAARHRDLHDAQWNEYNRRIEAGVPADDAARILRGDYSIPDSMLADDWEEG